VARFGSLELKVGSRKSAITGFPESEKSYP